MSTSHVLTGDTFEFVRDGAIYRVKATAVFILNGATTGQYHISFDIKTGQFPGWQPDRKSYSSAKAKEEAERRFTSGEVKAYIERELQGWIKAGYIQPVT
jgi:hypothetical protein